MAAILTREEYLAAWSALHGGYDPRRRRLISGYLVTMYVLARPWARAGVHPNLVTLLGVLLTVMAPVMVWQEPSRAVLAGAGVVVMVTLLLDGVDGAVAALRQRATSFGGVLDGVADRVAEWTYLAVLWRLGADPIWLIAGGALTMLQEFARARAGALGADQVESVTVWERPTRAILVGMTCIGLAVVGPDALAFDAAVVAAQVWLVMSVIGVVQVLAQIRRALADR